MRFRYYLALIALLSVAIMFTSWATRHALQGGDKLPQKAQDFIIEVSKFPPKIISVLSLFNNIKNEVGNPNIYSKIHPTTEFTNNISGYILIPEVGEDGVSCVNLLNLNTKSKKVLYRWSESKSLSNYSGEMIESQSRRVPAFSSRNRIWHPQITREAKMIFCVPWNDIVCIDLKSGHELWRVYGAFHHSIEIDENGVIWACAAALYRGNSTNVLKSQKSNLLPDYEDQIVVKISSQGKILDKISVTDILINSGLEYLLFGVSNPQLNLDPIHLNQVYPIKHSEIKLSDRGDLLLSLRNMSTVLLVDSRSRKVSWYKTGPWMNQHSAQISKSQKLYLLDNHSFASRSGDRWLHPTWRTRIALQNLITESITYIDPEKFLGFPFRVSAEGRVSEIDDDLWLLEDSHGGSVFIVHEDKLLFKYSDLYSNGNAGLISWARYVQSDMLPEILAK